MHALISHLIPFGAALCGSPAVMASGLFLTALLGSLAHCMPMCGPFVLMQSAARHEGPLLQRLAGAALMPYHLGRLVTYTALGALAGGAGEWMTGGGAVLWPLGIVLGVAAVAFLSQAVNQMASSSSGPLTALLARPLAGLVVPLAARCPQGFCLGLLLGLLPCGFLYAALAAAGATGSAAGGTMAMAAFAAGTIPGLILVGTTGRAFILRWRHWAGYLLGALFLVNGLTLAAASVHLLLS